MITGPASSHLLRPHHTAHISLRIMIFCIKTTQYTYKCLLNCFMICCSFIKTVICMYETIKSCRNWTNIVGTIFCVRLPAVNCHATAAILVPDFERVQREFVYQRSYMCCLAYPLAMASKSTGRTRTMALCACCRCGRGKVSREVSRLPVFRPVGQPWGSSSPLRKACYW